jgi:alkaline phosphatase
VYAEEAGLATGMVATSTITHATPASFIAHDENRYNYEAIARDFLDIDIDVFIGGGLNHFTNRVDGLNLIDTLKSNSYQVVLHTQELEGITSGKLVGLLNNESMPRMTAGREDMLLKSSLKAIEILSQHERGFFLMIEGSQIDWGGHDNNIEYVVTELLDFDKVIGAALDFAVQDGNTLVIITADHETGGLTILGDSIMGDSRAINFSTTNHTAIMVPVYAFGPQADKFSGIYENNLLFNKMMEALGLNWE